MSFGGTHSQIRIVLTGGPSAGKTTLLDCLSKEYGHAVAVAPEAASILFRGGFPRPTTADDRLHTQRSIYALQRELEASAIEKTEGAPCFCDRGSLDGAAYWDGSLKEFCFAMGTALERELSRYAMVLHLETAPEDCGYTNSDVRTETFAEAAALDGKIGAIWRQHPNYVFIGNNAGTFVDKLNAAFRALKPYLPTAQVLGKVQKL